MAAPQSFYLPSNGAPHLPPTTETTTHNSTLMIHSPSAEAISEVCVAAQAAGLSCSAHFDLCTLQGPKQRVCLAVFSLVSKMGALGGLRVALPSSLVLPALPLRLGVIESHTGASLALTGETHRAAPGDPSTYFGVSVTGTPQSVVGAVNELLTDIGELESLVIRKASAHPSLPAVSQAPPNTSTETTAALNGNGLPTPQRQTQPSSYSLYGPSPWHHQTHRPILHEHLQISTPPRSMTPPLNHPMQPPELQRRQQLQMHAGAGYTNFPFRRTAEGPSRAMPNIPAYPLHTGSRMHRPEANRPEANRSVPPSQKREMYTYEEPRPLVQMRTQPKIATPKQSPEEDVQQNDTKFEMKLPQKFVPRLIGAGGSCIREFQEKSGAFLDYSRVSDENGHCTVLMRGTGAQVEHAKGLVRGRLALWVTEAERENANDADALRGLSQGGGVTERYGDAMSTLLVPDALVGRLVGLRGRTVASIEASSGATVSLEKRKGPTRREPCVRGFRLVHLTGPNQSRETARRLVMDVLGVQLESFSPDFYKRSGERERERGGFSSQSDAFRPLPLHGCGALPLSTMTHSSTSPPSSSASAGTGEGELDGAPSGGSQSGSDRHVRHQEQVCH
uniref:K Homology domain-containing protein n=1 Tax=Chromera velia CCMP2878 TaxID=1169474 RepID=A0A0G4HB56_9ALVE|eukprot:Cvel_25762.t1-p1 / transcript=Cvel_25762.t1 / gene=Cvel_25762 / organism=Chromera_velia_CCMP2878 / gene_product=hypothetical protein / transcript_product=hypothetical protein / location=Cvel_scaffold2967:5703-8003(+) / protein_length=618 / sequence_SO=supercontig / SO=protein_coding / is_pseudo=false